MVIWYTLLQFALPSYNNLVYYVAFYYIIPILVYCTYYKNLATLLDSAMYVGWYTGRCG
jgi:hypothetical protein